MASSNVISTSEYRGVNTSLYTSLPEFAVSRIEQALLLKVTGQVFSARAIFTEELTALRNIPIVAIEHADLELEAGRWGAAWKILDSARDHFRNVGADFDLPEHRLIALTWAMLGVRHRGDLDSAIRELERTRQWLWELPISEYTDVQASCVRRYVITYLLTKTSSTFDSPAMEQIPLSSTANSTVRSTVRWAGLHCLRRSLMERRLYYEATALFRVEFNRTPLLDREKVAQEFLKSIENIPKRRGGKFTEASVRLQWSTTYREMNMLSRAQEELDNSQVAFDDWCSTFNVIDKTIAPHSLLMQYERLGFLTDSSERLSETKRCIELMLQAGTISKVGTLLSTASECAFILFQSTNEMVYLESFLELHERLRHFNENESEDLCDLVNDRLTLFSFTNASMVHRQKSLEWIDGFLEQYEYFRPPGEMERLYRMRAHLLLGLQRHEESQEAERIANEYKTKGPSLGNLFNLNLNNILIPKTGPIALVGYEAEEESENDLFFEPWLGVGADASSIEQKAVGFILGWSLEDLEAGRLTSEQFQEMMNVSHSQIGCLSGDNKLQQLTDLESGNITNVLFPFDMDTVKIRQSQWQLILKWLSNPPTGQKYKRLHSLLVLRNARQLHFCDHELWDERIGELQSLQEMYPKLPNAIRAISNSVFACWPGDLAMTYMAKIEGPNVDFGDPETYEVLVKAEQHHESSLEHLRANYWPGQLAIQLRTGAQICLYKIRQHKMLLDQQATQPIIEESTQRAIDTRMAEVRKLGLEKVEETDQILTESEIHASWLQGLQGIVDRQNQSKSQGGFFTVISAITLLLSEPGEPSQDTITQAWEWVQKYKSRSLARTMGTRASHPPSLVSQINEDPIAAIKYKEMLDIKRQIEETPLDKRFDLRQKSEELQRSMKTIPLLRRLIDLIEGAPLQLSEIANIQSDVESPIVLVDWFVLPPSVCNDNARILLFTARVNSPPTMDIVTTSPGTIDAWIRDHLNSTSLGEKDHRPHFNDTLGGLIAPLNHRTKPDETLVFCPSLHLHRVPLHALILESANAPLINRNPVVYIHSQSLLRLCHAAADEARHSAKSMNPLFFSGISKTQATEEYVVNGERFKVNYTAGRERIQALAKDFNTSPMMDEHASKANLLSGIEKSRLIHLHTHCNWTSNDPLSHHITFPKLNEAENDDGNKLSAREVFDIRFLPGTHVNMISCEAALTDVQMGDDVMGLVPALQYSGGTSIITTLWKIRDGDGARFSRGFFEGFREQCREQSAGDRGFLQRLGRWFAGAGAGAGKNMSVDLAVAVQRAVLDMDPFGAEPLGRAAGFVMCGFWGFGVGDGEGMGFGGG
ncbi:tetratricopeptide repeat protein [Rutstroemia sp. NJR-2017a BBW]|nr:tetratricopeptide repeat protein [Rutstroemia sp. NJR-2017a BBW]